MSLITTIAQFKTYVSISGDTNIDRLKPSIAQAEAKEIKNLLGTAEYTALVADISAGEPQTQKYIDLIPYVRNVLANYAMVRFVGTGNVSMTGSGMMVDNFQHSEAAPKWKVTEAKADLMNFGDEAADQLLQYLEDNAGTYTLWAASTANSLATGAFITSTTQVADAIGMNINRSLFIRLKPHLARAERHAGKLVGASQYAELQSQITAGTLSTENNLLVVKLRTIIAHMAVVEALPLMPVQLTGDGIYSLIINDGIARQVAAKSAQIKETQKALSTIQEADTQDFKQFLIDNVDDYPLYKASASYTSRPDPGPSRPPVNKKENHYFGV